MEKVISKDGTEIAFDRMGSGPPLILVHGAMIYRSFPQAVALAKELSAQFTVINYDRRGRGDSGDTLPYSPEREIEDIDAIIKTLGESPYLFGMSSGAALVIHSVAQSLQIRKIALYEPPFVATNFDQQQASLKFISEVQSMIAQNRRGDAMKSFMKKVGVPAPIRIFMPLMSFWKHGLKIAHTLPYDLTILSDQSVPKELLAKIRIPSLVMSGESTAPALRMAAEATAQSIPHCEYKILAKQSHNVSPKVLAAELAAFFIEKNKS
jgi:pimeloyl-ACP methyl ester carboxylesterase